MEQNVQDVVVGAHTPARAQLVYTFFLVPFTFY